MFCESYRQPLSDAALTGELTAKLSQHLAACAPCRATLAQEQSLFAAIDSGLRAVANPEVPTTLIPRIHVALNGPALLPVRGASLLPLSIVGAAAAAAIIVIFLYMPARHTSTPAQVVQEFPTPAAPKGSFSASDLNPAASGDVSPLRHVKVVAPVESSGSNPRLPEVLVSPNEKAALLRYQEALRRNRAGSIFVASAKSLALQQGIEPLRFAEVELSDVSIPTLSKWETEDDTK
jgi:hypothetical protein